MPKYVVLDTETTSLDTRNGALWEVAIIVRDTDEPKNRVQEFWWQVRPDLLHADPNSLRVGRYYERAKMLGCEIGDGVELAATDCGPDDALVENVYGKTAKEGEVILEMSGERIALALAEQLDGATIVANNPAFDHRFLVKFLRENGQTLTASHRMIDVRALAMGYMHGRLRNRTVAEEFNGDPAAETLAASWLSDWPSTSIDWRMLNVNSDLYEAHTALGDARLVRDVLNAVTGGTKR
ncbi:hypothetical protein ACQPYK_25150 [Streptosporangium sp. CA-135522]|uniref:3'-5' exonuclease n=1 Tax=Streptosporangium sp. CA-135522 TaxID=3240072 RepID=UPI003D8F7915